MTIKLTRRGTISRRPLRNVNKGTCSELIACVWLLQQGYEVFRNVGPHGLVDIVAIKDGEIKKFDVKSGPHKLKARSVSAGVLPLYVANDGSCSFDRNTVAYAARKARMEGLLSITSDLRERAHLAPTS